MRMAGKPFLQADTVRVRGGVNLAGLDVCWNMAIPLWALVDDEHASQSDLWWQTSQIGAIVKGQVATDGRLGSHTFPEARAKKIKVPRTNNEAIGSGNLGVAFETVTWT